MTAIAARCDVPVVCLVPDVLRVLSLSKSQFYALRRAGRFPLEPMASLDGKLRFSGFDVVDYVRRRGQVQRTETQQPDPVSSGRRFLTAARRVRRHTSTINSRAGADYTNPGANSRGKGHDTGA